MILGITLLAAMCLTACSNNKMSLSCGDTEINDLVLKISTEELMLRTDYYKSIAYKFLSSLQVSFYLMRA